MQRKKTKNVAVAVNGLTLDSNIATRTGAPPHNSNRLRVENVILDRLYRVFVLPV